MRPILFLDIDGVLNCARFVADHTGGEGVRILDGELDATHHLDPARVACLDAFVREMDVDVVLSSSWRLVFGLEKTERSLRARGFTHALHAATPRLAGMPRHAEIRAFLTRPPDVAFVVLDDDAEAGEGHEAHFVHVVDGLEPEHLARARVILLAT